MESIRADDVSRPGHSGTVFDLHLDDGKRLARNRTGTAVAVNVRPPWAERIVQAVNSHDELVEALREIAKGEGEYSFDPLTHAGNTIESMIEIALAALAKVEGA